MFCFCLFFIALVAIFSNLFLFVFCPVDALLWLGAFSQLTNNISSNLVPMIPVWMCGVGRTWRFHLRFVTQLIYWEYC